MNIINKFVWGRLSPLAILMAGAFSVGNVCAVNVATPPDAGALSNQLRQGAWSPQVAPAASNLVIPEGGVHSGAGSDNGARFVLKNIIVSDISGVVPVRGGVTDAQRRQIIDSWINKSVSFSQLQTVADQITVLYRQHGLLLARAVLPPQTIRGGVVSLQIIPGTYDKARTDNATALHSAVIQHLINTTTPEGALVRRGKLERVALLLDEIPGVQAQSSIRPGTVPGSSALLVDVKPGARVTGYIGGDNQGESTTGRNRLMAGASINNPMGWGDVLNIDVLGAGDKAGLLNAGLDYSALLGGYYGARAGVNYSHLNYRYTLQRIDFKGYSDSFGGYFTLPIVRSATSRMDVRTDLRTQWLNDRYPAFADLGLGNSRKQVTSGDIALSGASRAIPGGVSGGALTGTVGNVLLQNEAAETFSAIDGGGAFARLNYQINHLQAVGGPFSAWIRLSGQQSDHNLDSSQKLILGGPDAVRAYDIGEGSVDNGNIMTAEARSLWPLSGIHWLGRDPTLTVAAFYDQGWGNQYHTNHSAGNPALTDHNHLNLAGGGVYSTVADAGNYAVTFTWARRTGAAVPDTQKQDENHFWLSSVKTF